MAVQNKTKVYGQAPGDTNNVFPTGSEKYNTLFEGVGAKPNELAKAQDVLTPLRELTLFSVGFLNWLAQFNFHQYTPEGEVEPIDVSHFEDAEVTGNDTADKQNCANAVRNIEQALKQAITESINSKEAYIDRDNNTKKGFLTFNGTNWVWDGREFQVSAEVLTAITNFFNTSNKGILYKAENGAKLQTSNLPFVYFDSESTEGGNKIANLKTFTFPKTNQ